MPKKFSQRAEDLRRALAQEAARIMASTASRISCRPSARRPTGWASTMSPCCRKTWKSRRPCASTSACSTAIRTTIRSGAAPHRPRRDAHAGRIRTAAVGSVLTGTATNYSDINLHLFADASSPWHPAARDWVPHEFYERRVKMDAERSINYPALRFAANGGPSTRRCSPSTASANRPTRQWMAAR